MAEGGEEEDMVVVVVVAAVIVECLGTRAPGSFSEQSRAVAGEAASDDDELALVLGWLGAGLEERGGAGGGDMDQSWFTSCLTVIGWSSSLPPLLLEVSSLERGKEGAEVRARGGLEPGRE